MGWERTCHSLAPFLFYKIKLPPTSCWLFTVYFFFHFSNGGMKGGKKRTFTLVNMIQLAYYTICQFLRPPPHLLPLQQMPESGFQAISAGIPFAVCLCMCACVCFGAQSWNCILSSFVQSNTLCITLPVPYCPPPLKNGCSRPPISSSHPILSLLPLCLITCPFTTLEKMAVLRHKLFYLSFSKYSVLYCAFLYPPPRPLLLDLRPSFFSNTPSLQYI